MITFMRTANIRDGKAIPAVEWSLKVAAYLNETYQMNVAVHRNVAGQLNQLHWISTHDSLAEVEQIAAKLQADAGYQQLLAESIEDPLFFADSIIDNLYQSIP